MRSADVYYLCLPMSMSRATKKMPPGLKTGLPKGDAHGAGRDRSPDHPQRQASPPRAPALAVGGASGDAAALEGPPAGPHGYGPLAPPKAGGNLNKIRTEDVVVVPDLDPEVADLKVTGRGAGDALFGRAPGENFHHCLVISSGLLDLLEPGEVRAALAGALVSGSVAGRGRVISLDLAIAAVDRRRMQFIYAVNIMQLLSCVLPHLPSARCDLSILTCQRTPPSLPGPLPGPPAAAPGRGRRAQEVRGGVRPRPRRRRHQVAATGEGSWRCSRAGTAPSGLLPYIGTSVSAHLMCCESLFSTFSATLSLSL